jgi:hypothetical protein
VQVGQQELSEGIRFEVDPFDRLGSQWYELKLVLAAGRVGELWAAVVGCAGRPGTCAGEVEVLEVAPVIEDVQEAP